MIDKYGNSFQQWNQHKFHGEKKFKRALHGRFYFLDDSIQNMLILVLAAYLTVCPCISSSFFCSLFIP